MIKWNVVTKTGLVLAEGTNTFPDIKDIQNVYLERNIAGNKQYFGVNRDLTFFSNQQLIDLNLIQNILSIRQYKTDVFYLQQNVVNTFHRIEINTEDDNYKYIYIISVSDTEQYLECRKIDGIHVNRRIIYL